MLPESLNHADRASERKRILRDVKVVLKEKERELAIVQKQVEALKIAAVLLVDAKQFELGNALPISEEENKNR